MKTRTEQILTIMNVLAWIAFIGLMVQAGAFLVSYGVTYLHPEASKNLYLGLDLHALMEFDFLQYSLSVYFIVTSLCMKALVAFLIIKTLSKVNLKNPFTISVVRKLEIISYILVGIWFISVVNNAHNEWLRARITNLPQDWSAGEFLFIAGLVFIISQIFKRGVEIQSEHELTV